MTKKTKMIFASNLSKTNRIRIPDYIIDESTIKPSGTYMSVRLLKSDNKKTQSELHDWYMEEILNQEDRVYGIQEIDVLFHATTMNHYRILLPRTLNKKFLLDNTHSVLCLIEQIYFDIDRTQTRKKTEPIVELIPSNGEL